MTPLMRRMRSRFVAEIVYLAWNVELKILDDFEKAIPSMQLKIKAET